MKMAVFWPVTVLLLAVLGSAKAEDGDKPSYCLLGGKLTLVLGPTGSERITSILWKYKSDLLAEWVENVVPLVYYEPFKGRATLDISTGRLEVTKMSEADLGLYTVEINNKVQGQRYLAKAIEKVPKPLVWIQPVGCNPTSVNCTLRCDGDTSKAEPVTYSWKKGDGAWEKLGKEINIIKSETGHVETFSCRMKNPVSEEESEPKDNPLFQEETPGGSNVGEAVGGSIIGLLLLIGGVVGYVKRDAIKDSYRRYQSSRTNTGSPAKESSGHLLDGVRSNSDGQTSPAGQPSSDVESPPGGQPPLDGQPPSDGQPLPGRQPSPVGQPPSNGQPPPDGQPSPVGQVPSNGQPPLGGNASVPSEETPLNTPEATDGAERA
ncbi:uncharacterized protein [Chaetodon trifascialis]|uniref:uncharacterized protein n=1 Tax=Chaetodon trifascialis TaxID=109706 RepID=UPI003992D1B5